jgi:hypothetical protein
MPYLDPQDKKAWRQRYRERQHDILRQLYEWEGSPLPPRLQVSYPERLRRAEERRRLAEERQQRRARNRQCRQCQQPAAPRRRHCSDACAESGRQLRERARYRRRAHDRTLARRLVESLMPPQLEYVGERCLLLSWRKLQIFSALQNAGASGLSLVEILSAVWQRGPVWRQLPAVKPNTILVHLRQLNVLLAETNLRIGSNGRASARRWHLERRP